MNFAIALNVGRIGSRVMRQCAGRWSLPAKNTCQAGCRLLASRADLSSMSVTVEETRAVEKEATNKDDKPEKVLIESCGAVDEDGDDDEMEQEEMFVEPHESFQHRGREWGGPRRGGRLPEPTRFGDWERKGRCTDF